MLESPYGSLREVAVEQLFEWLAVDEGHERALELLSHTPWSATNEPQAIANAKAELSKLLLLA